MKQQKSPHTKPLKKDSSPKLGMTTREKSEILEKLSTIEDLLKKKDDKPLTFKEACTYLGYAPSYLYKLTYKKLIPHYKPTGKMIFFSKNELDQWIYKSGCQNSEISSQNDSSSASSTKPSLHSGQGSELRLGVTNENKGGSTMLITKDPNQIEMGFGDKARGNSGEAIEKDASTDSAQEIVIEFPLKSRRKK